MMMDLDDGMDVEMPDLPEFDMLEVVDGPPYQESSSKVLEEWRKPNASPPLDDVVDEIMQMDVQLSGIGEDLLDEKFFFNEDPCLSPTSALDDLVFSNASLDEKELTLFAYPEEDNDLLPPVTSVPSNIPTPPPSMSSFTKPKPKPIKVSAPISTAKSTTAAPPVLPPVNSNNVHMNTHAVPVPRAPVPVPAAPTSRVPAVTAGGPPKAPVARTAVTPGRPPVPAHYHPHAHPHHPPHIHPHHAHYPHHQVPPPVRPTATKPKAKPASRAATTTAPKSRSRPKQKKAPPKLNYTPAPPHMQPKPIAVAAAAIGAKRAAAIAARIPATPPKKNSKKPSSAPQRKAPAPSSSKRSNSRSPIKKPTKASLSPPRAGPPPPPPAFMKDEKYQATLQKLTQSMIRSQESRKCFHMQTPKTEKYARVKSVHKVLSSIDHSTRQIQTYLQGPAYRCGALPPSSTKPKTTTTTSTTTTPIKNPATKTMSPAVSLAVKKASSGPPVTAAPPVPPSTHKVAHPPSQPPTQPRKN